MAVEYFAGINYTWAEIDKIHALARDHCHGWAGALRFGIWRAGTEKNYADILSETERQREQEKQYAESHASLSLRGERVRCCS